ncbi:hypothetical protein Tco_0879998 [Tanacetum coccineum]
MSDEPLGDDSKPISYDVTFSNPLFDFNDDFTLCNDNPLFDEEFENISSLDPQKLTPVINESTLLVTLPLPYTDVFEDDIIDTDLLLGEHLDTLSTGDREIDFNPSRDIEELERLLADNHVPAPRVFDVPLGNSDSMSSSSETSDLFEKLTILVRVSLKGKLMRLNRAQTKSDSIRIRCKEEVMEKEFMHKQFDDATKKLKTELGSRGSEILNLKNGLHFQQKGDTQSFITTNVQAEGRSWPYTYSVSNNPPHFKNEPDFPPANCHSGVLGAFPGSISSQGEGTFRFPVCEKEQPKIRAPMAELKLDLILANEKEKKLDLIVLRVCMDHISSKLSSQYIKYIKGEQATEVVFVAVFLNQRQVCTSKSRLLQECTNNEKETAKMQLTTTTSHNVNTVGRALPIDSGQHVRADRKATR